MVTPMATHVPWRCIALVVSAATLSPPVALAQGFSPFDTPGPPARRTIFLAQGWHVAAPPTRTSEGLRIAVRSESGELRDMLIGADGSVALRDANPALAGPRPQRSIVHAKPKPKPKIAVLRPAQVPPHRPAGSVASQVDDLPVGTTPATPATVKPAPPAPVGTSEGAGYAHGVPINPLD